MLVYAENIKNGKIGCKDKELREKLTSYLQAATILSRFVNTEDLDLSKISSSDKLKMVSHMIEYRKKIKGAEKVKLESYIEILISALESDPSRTTASKKKGKEKEKTFRWKEPKKNTKKKKEKILK